MTTSVRPISSLSYDEEDLASVSTVVPSILGSVDANDVEEDLGVDPRYVAYDSEDSIPSRSLPSPPSDNGSISSKEDSTSTSPTLDASADIAGAETVAAYNNVAETVAAGDNNNNGSYANRPMAAFTIDSKVGKPSKVGSRRVIWISIISILVIIGVILMYLHITTEHGLKELFVPPTDFPSSAPSMSPTTSFPSESPSISIAPSDLPSKSPSQFPSGLPSEHPSEMPSEFPSLTPTMNPTFETYQVNKAPRNPPKGYFNYDKDDSKYGPYKGRRWADVNTTRHWLREFTDDGWGPWKGHLAGKDPLKNRCDMEEEKMSPKDLRSTSSGGVCEAEHEIRTKCGPNPINYEGYKRLILPHKLSLEMNRRKCVDDDTEDNDKCDMERPPVADFPKYAATGSSYSDLLNVDIKLPGEHRIEGESFDAEIQMFHMHYTRDRVGSIGIPVRAVKQNGFNEEFQFLIDEFQKTFDADLAACTAKQKRKRQLRDNGIKNSTFFEFGREYAINTTRNMQAWAAGPPTPPPTESTEPERKNEFFDEKGNLKKEEALFNEKGKLIKPKDLPPNQYTNYDPYSDAFMPGMFFYRYDGSITEPPCMLQTWWVMSNATIISMEQLGQLKEILFDHVDKNCRRTSVHNMDQSVTRPIFSSKRVEGKGIENCIGAFIADTEKNRPPGKKCARY